MSQDKTAISTRVPASRPCYLLHAIAPRAIELFDRMCVEREPATTTPAQQPQEQ